MRPYNVCPSLIDLCTLKRFKLKFSEEYTNGAKWTYKDRIEGLGRSFHFPPMTSVISIKRKELLNICHQTNNFFNYQTIFRSSLDTAPKP